MRRHIQMDYLFINKGMRYVGYKRERENHVIFIHSRGGSKKKLCRKIRKNIRLILPSSRDLFVGFVIRADAWGAPGILETILYGLFFI